MPLREYQKRPTAKAIDFFKSKKPTPQVMVFPTAWGKSHLIAHTIKEVGGKFIILQPNKELLLQNLEKYKALGKEASIYSASLNSKKMGNVTFATIGSVKEKASEFKKLGVKRVIIDEADRFPQDSGMLPSFLKGLGTNHILGITATPIKATQTKYGKQTRCITSGLKRDRIFDDMLHVSQVSEMVEGGWWAPLVYEVEETDSSMLTWVNGGDEYTKVSLSKYYERNSLHKKINKVLEKHSERKSWLIFVPSVLEATELASKLKGFEAITGETKAKDRKEFVDSFKAGKLKGLISVSTLYVGFDHPPVDGIIGARPTGSISWYIQSVGRGVRLSDQKENCLIVDLAGNTDRFGKVEEMFYSHSGEWHLYNGERKRLTGYISRTVVNRVTAPAGYKMKKNNVMPFGRYKGVRLKNLPADVIHHLYKEAKYKIDNPSIKAEIFELYQQYKYV